MYPLFDAHCDTASEILAAGQHLYKNSLHTDLYRGGRFAPRGQVYALWHDCKSLSIAAAKVEYWRIYRNFVNEIRRNYEFTALCGSYAEIKTAIALGKQAALLSCEGAELLGCCEAELERAAEQGLRIVNLCWNYDNALCGSAMDSGGGLSAKGRAFVRRAGSLGVIIDLSHASDQTVEDVLSLGSARVFASHSNCRALCNHPRNLPDELLSDIAAAGGVIGLNLYPLFLGGNQLSLAANHVMHMLSVCGAGAVCLGCDLDGVSALPEGIVGIEDMGNLMDTLLTAKIPRDTAEDIFFGNLMKFWESAL